MRLTENFVHFWRQIVLDDENQNLPCSSADWINVCFAAVFYHPGFGEPDKYEVLPPECDPLSHTPAGADSLSACTDRRTASGTAICLAYRQY
jgi:hypothetical protein